MRQQIKAAADCYHFRLYRPGQVAQFSDIDGVAVGINRSRVNIEAVKAGATGYVVGDMATDRRRRDNDAVAWPGRDHEGVEVGDRSGWHADLGIFRAEDLRREFRSDDLDPLDTFQAHFIFVAGIAKRRARSQAGGQRCLGLRIHDIGRRVEVDAVGFVDRAVQFNTACDCRHDGISRLMTGFLRQLLGEHFAM